MRQTDINHLSIKSNGSYIHRNGLVVASLLIVLSGGSWAEGETANREREIRVTQTLSLYPATNAETVPTGTNAFEQVAAGLIIRIVSQCTLQNELWYWVCVLEVRENVGYTIYNPITTGWIKAKELTEKQAASANHLPPVSPVTPSLPKPVRIVSPVVVEPPKPVIQPALQIGGMSYAILEAKWLAGMESPLPAGNAPHLVVKLWVRNDDTDARFMPFVGLVDEANTEYDPIVKGTAEYRMDLTLFRPREERRGTFVFAASDKHRYRLRVSGGWLSRAQGDIAIRPTAQENRDTHRE